jgi:hypothetical protein
MSEKEFDELKKMELHDEKNFNNVIILRVPGGWIYTTYSDNGTGGYEQSACFVPFDFSRG